VLLEVRHLTKRFGGLTAVSDISFGLDEGDIVGVFGPNGSGKTTLLNLISGVYPPSEGQLLWKGSELLGNKPHEIAETGIVKTFQNPQLFGELSVFDNVAIAGHLRLKRHSGWRRCVGAPARISSIASGKSCVFAGSSPSVISRRRASPTAAKRCSASRWR
jgi:branched-chain amino acid transport system ATP-binding protein